MRKACSTQSTYSAGVSRPIMSVRLRISVLRFRQLSTRPTLRLDPAAHKVDERVEVDLS